MNDVGKADIKERDLERLLETGRRILLRIGEIQRRLCDMDFRLYGVAPEVSFTSENDPVAGGILGAFQEMHGDSDRRCDSVEEWLTSIERAV